MYVFGSETIIHSLLFIDVMKRTIIRGTNVEIEDVFFFTVINTNILMTKVDKYCLLWEVLLLPSLLERETRRRS